MAKAISIAVLVVVVVAAFAMALDAMSSTGPNCPGMDPTWLGRCEVSQ